MPVFDELRTCVCEGDSLIDGDGVGETLGLPDTLPVNVAPEDALRVSDCTSEPDIDIVADFEGDRRRFLVNADADAVTNAEEVAVSVHVRDEVHEAEVCDTVDVVVRG